MTQFAFFLSLFRGTGLYAETMKTHSHVAMFSFTFIYFGVLGAINIYNTMSMFS